jgi:altronate hydrolase
MGEDMDVNAGRILMGDGGLDYVAGEICELTAEVAAGALTASETLGHREFVLGYKSFEPAGPACHPASLPMAAAGPPPPRG